MSGVLIRGSLVHYETLGRGQPIVFIHGWLGSWRYWVPIMEDLATDHRTYALDLWGFGDSDKGRDLYDIDGYVELVLDFMDALGIGRAPLVGHTLGAAVAARLAASHPERVSRVLAIGLPLSADSINRRLLTTGPNDTMARLFWHRQRPHAEVELGIPKMAQNAVALTIQSVARLDMRQTLAEVQAPLLMVYGDRDNVISSDDTEELAEPQYAARTILFLEAHHFPMLDQAAKLGRLLRDFMDVDTPEQLQELTIKTEWRRRTR
ncbi:MAG: alpha/beta fold hydrolase [Anaerolineae bacterium]|nr:alpha/beta fold hydrolase [Anaerolineae bacterium]